LALVFNDIKGLTHFHDFVKEFRKPALGEVSGHAGVYGGIRLQIFKMSVGVLNEFLKFLRENKELFESTEFKQYIHGLSVDSTTLWELLVTTSSNGKDKNSQARKKLLARIRNETAFHYSQSSDALKTGFRIKFFGPKFQKESGANAAYYSATKTDYDGIRFYYADAALEGYLEERLSEVGDSSVVVGDIYELMIAVSKVIADILDEYHKMKPSA